MKSAINKILKKDGDTKEDLLNGGLQVNQSSFIRDDWIEKQLQLRVKEFTEEKKLTVYIGTWNVNGKKPTEDLAPWIVAEPTPDIYAVGFQEIVDLNAGNLLVDHSASKPWEDRIEKTLKQQYIQISSKHLVGLSMCIYVKRHLHPFVTDVQSDTVGVGIMGVGGNKGAVAIRFQIYDSTMCFVNSHLAAHQHNCAGRNADFHNICQRVKFVDRNKLASTTTTSTIPPSNTNTNNQNNKAQYGLYQHDFLFWLGDLNYRLNVTDMALVYQRIDVQDWPFLLSHDQLIIEKNKGEAFKKFKEGEIDFAPSYKFQPGTHLYEQRPDKKKRTPAWCDRIQWVGEDVTQLWYRRAQELCVSDHKPVMALFDVAGKILIPDKKKEVQASLGRQLDAWENECIPKVSMSPASIKFPKVTFDEPLIQRLVIENTGQVVVQFHFIPKLQEAAFCKQWLSVTPEFGIIPPKENMEINISVHVTRISAPSLLNGTDTLQDTLILKLENGPDYFIPISGDYQKSSFGSTIDYLVNTPSPVRFASSPKDGTTAKVLSLPKELWRIVDFIYKNGMDEEGIFSTNGVPSECDRIREALDCGTDFDPSISIYSMAETLIYFFKSLAEPVYPNWLVEQYSEGMNLTPYCKSALMQLTPSHYNCFIYVIAFLRELLRHRDNNRLTAVSLVLIFSACLMHASVELETGGGKDKPKSWVILRHFLTSDEFV